MYIYNYMNSQLPNQIFFSGSFGSKWDSISQVLKQLSGIESRLIYKQDYSEMLPELNQLNPEDWIMLVHRQYKPSLDLWLKTGEQNMQLDQVTDLIKKQNQFIMRWVFEKNLKLERFTPHWVEREFGQNINFDSAEFDDVFVTIYKPI